MQIDGLLDTDEPAPDEEVTGFIEQTNQLFVLSAFYVQKVGAVVAVKG